MDEHEHHEHQHHGTYGHGGHAHHLDFDAPAMADFAELEGEVLRTLTEQAVDAIAERCTADGVDVRRVIDVGSGPGIASCLLATAFPAAAVVAADGSDVMLERARARAGAQGLGDRISTQRVELPDGAAEVGRADVVWASMVLHHVGDEVDVLRRLGALVEPGGVLAVVEIEEPVRVVSEGSDLGRPGLVPRLDEAWREWFAVMRANLPGSTASAPYGAMIQDAGLDLVGDVVVRVELGAPLDDRALRFARRQIEFMRTALDGRADPADLDALAGLVEPTGADGAGSPLVLRAARHLFLARPTL